MPAVELLPDELWAEVEPLLPPPPPRSPKGGRPPVDNRDALRGIIFVNRTGISWQMLPAEVFGGQRLVLLATLPRVDGRGCVARGAPATLEPPGPARRRRRGPVAGGGGQPERPRRQRGAHTGPNPTDRGKRGCKRHVLTDADGVPLVVRTTGANVPDQAQLPALLESMPALPTGPLGRPKTRPDAIYGDRAYGTAEMIALMLVLHVVSYLAPRNSDTHGSGLGFFRFVVERTLACFSHFRRLRLCYRSIMWRRSRRSIAAA
jgi:Putative transposase of IS4/5 family (DUF4096)/Transposase DDE domain